MCVYTYIYIYTHIYKHIHIYVYSYLSTHHPPHHPLDTTGTHRLFQEARPPYINPHHNSIAPNDADAP